jgi:hypothetical protein
VKPAGIKDIYERQKLMSWQSTVKARTSETCVEE